MLINLLGNAVKFTPSGGRITLYAEPAPELVRIHVRDTGIGIEPAQLASIFEPFVQIEPALTRTTEGAGLGLAISRELARGMGGDLARHERAGRGLHLHASSYRAPRQGTSSSSFSSAPANTSFARCTPRTSASTSASSL